MLTYSLIAATAVSLISLLCITVLSIGRAKLNNYLSLIIAFAAGAILGDAFLHILPEVASEIGFTQQTALYIIAGIAIAYVFERYIHWHHCQTHHDHNHRHSLAYSNIFADCLHNLFDGVAIAAAFTISPTAGIATTIAIVFHEIPQECGDFAIMIYSGFTIKRAIALNLLTALTAVLGVLAVHLLGSAVTGIVPYLLLVTAGNFIYLALSDIIPELKGAHGANNSLKHLVFIALGVATMYALTLVG